MPVGSAIAANNQSPPCCYFFLRSYDIYFHDILTRHKRKPIRPLQLSYLYLIILRGDEYNTEGPAEGPAGNRNMAGLRLTISCGKQKKDIGHNNFPVPPSSI